MAPVLEKRLEPRDRPVDGAAALVAAAPPRLRENPDRLVCGAVDVRPEPKFRPVAGAEVVVREKGVAEAAGFPKLKPVVAAAGAAAVDAAGAPIGESKGLVMDPIKY